MEVVIDAGHRGPLVNVGIWIALVPCVLAVFIKLYIKWDTARRMNLDDYFLVLAFIAAVGQNVATSEQTVFGLGSHAATVSADNVVAFEKAQYAATILYVPAIYLAKLTSLYFFTTIAASKARLLAIRIWIWGIAAWTLVAFLVAIFQCKVSEPWSMNHAICINKPAFWVFNAIVDILSALQVGLLPILLLHDLRIQTSKKYFIMLSFTPNLLTIPLTILRMVYVFNVHNGSDSTWDTFEFALVSGLQVTLAVFLTCIPFSKPVMDSLILEPQIIRNEYRPYPHSSRQTRFRGTGASSAAGTDGKSGTAVSGSRWAFGLSSHYPETTAPPDNQGQAELQELEIRTGSQDPIVTRH